MKLQTTYVSWEYSNGYIKLKIYEHLRSIKHSPFTHLSEYHKRRRFIDLQKLIVAGQSKLGAPVTFDVETLRPIDHGKERIGRPSLNWYDRTMEEMWIEVSKPFKRKRSSILE